MSFQESAFRELVEIINSKTIPTIKSEGLVHVPIDDEQVHRAVLTYLEMVFDYEHLDEEKTKFLNSFDEDLKCITFRLFITQNKRLQTNTDDKIVFVMNEYNRLMNTNYSFDEMYKMFEEINKEYTYRKIYGDIMDLYQSIISS